jgi:TolB protein
LPGFLYPQIFNAKVAARDSTDPNWVQLTYGVKNEAANAIIVEESTASQDEISNAISRTTNNIDTVTVGRNEVTNGSTHSVFYTWLRSGISYRLTADLSEQMTDSVLEQMVESMLKPPNNDLTPASDGSTAGKIVFTSTRSGNGEIYAIKPDGSGLRQLTNDPDMDFNPIWSPDGTKIAFMRVKATPDVVNAPPGARPPISIYVMNADGSDQRNLTPEGVRSFRNLTWSPDSKQLAVECTQKLTDPDGNGQICVINVDGSGVQRVVPPQLFGTSPSWSPDGRWIAFRGQASSMDQPAIGIYLVSPDGKQLRTITAKSSTPDPLAWSPDGTRLAYAFGKQPKDIAVIDVDGSGEHDIALNTTSLSDPLWSPDGTRFLIMSEGGVSVINVDGTGMREVVSPDEHVISAIWSPVGQSVGVTQQSTDLVPATPGTTSFSVQLSVYNLAGSPPRTLLEENTATDGDGLFDSSPAWQPTP